MRKIFILLIIFFSVQTALHAEDNYCYQKPDKCAAGDILVLSIVDDVAKYCDFDKQMIAVDRRVRSSSAFNSQEIVCVKIATPRKNLK